MKLVFTRAIAACLLMIVVVSGFGSDKVLCFSRDGHVDIESSGNEDSHCGENNGGARRNCHDAARGQVAFVSGNDRCYRCLDIPLPALPAADCRIVKKFPTLLRRITPAAPSCVPLLNICSTSASYTSSTALNRRVFSRPDAAVVLRI